MSKELDAFKRITDAYMSRYRYLCQDDDFELIETALKDYQEIKEIAKRYNWDDIVSGIYHVKADKKYRELFDSAIVNIQEDYRKARAFEIITKYPKSTISINYLLYMMRFWEEENKTITKELLETYDFPYEVEEYYLLKEVLL